MKNFKNILIIYPQDPTLIFLQPIVDLIKKRIPNCCIDRPSIGGKINKVTDETDLVFFLGHGTPSKLLGSPDKEGKKTVLIDVPNGARLFNECSLILFSCNSADYLKCILGQSISIGSSIVFGDMPTDNTHIKHNQELYKNYWTRYDNSQLEFYKNVLVESIIYGVSKGVSTGSLYGFCKGITHIVNKKINEVIRSEIWDRESKLQLIERIIQYKKDIKYISII